MNIPEFLREENMKDTIDPEVKKAIQRFRDIKTILGSLILNKCFFILERQR